jgi:hypothetical protein
MTACLFERAPNQVDFKPAHFFVEIDAAADVADGGVTRALLVAGRDRLRIADLRAQALFGDHVGRRNHHRAFDRIFELAHVAGP